MNFGNVSLRINSQKSISVCICMWVNTIASKWCIRLSSISVCIRILQVTVGQTLLVLVDVRQFFFKKTEVQKIIHIHYSLWSQILKSVLVSKWSIRLRLNFVCILQATIEHTLLILMSEKLVDFLNIYFFTGVDKIILMHYSLWVKLLKVS